LEIVKREPLVPKVSINYERLAFLDKGNTGLRVSFDQNILSRREKVGLEHKNPQGQSLLKSGELLMEVKTRWVMPLWLTRTINDLGLMPISFSKYGKEYTNHIKKVRGYV
jgi:hypothetical protein